jgi:hypothetical protein
MTASIEVASDYGFKSLLCPEVGRKKAGREYRVIFRRPGCLGEILWAFRPTLADGLVLSCTTTGYYSNGCLYIPRRRTKSKKKIHILLCPGNGEGKMPGKFS